ncbi:MAG: hypothetical protein Q8909_11935 [Bacteroidota bacterium]|nr:hypothetical protein [Bacteroidota bacterium]
MRKNLWVAGISFLVMSGLQAQNNRPVWMPTVTIDGKLTEWQGQLHYYDKVSTMRYGFANDDKYLYFVFQVIESGGQMRIMRNGLNITLKTNIKPRITGTLKLAGQHITKEQMQEDFPKQGESDQSAQTSTEQGRLQQRRGSGVAVMKQMYLLNKPTMDITGFAGKSEMLVAGDNGETSFQVLWNDQDQMGIECRIPLSVLFGADYSLEKISAKEISLEINQDDPASGSHSGASFHAGGMGSGGMGRSGRMGGGLDRSGEMSTSGNDMFEKIDFKNKIILAVKP